MGFDTRSQRRNVAVHSLTANPRSFPPIYRRERTTRFRNDDGLMRLDRLALTLLLIASALLLNFLPQPQSASANEIWRVPIDQPKLVREFRQPNADWSAGHRGVDYLVSENQQVFASHSGVVSFTGRVVNRNLVSIRHENGFVTSYEPVCSPIRVNTRIGVNEVLGAICGDESYASHCLPRLCLHFSMRVENRYLSPLVMLGQLSPSRLKPWDGLRCNPLSSAQC